MTEKERIIVQEMADAYRILREAYHHDMHREEPPLTDLQIRVRDMLAKPVMGAKDYIDAVEGALQRRLTSHEQRKLARLYAEGDSVKTAKAAFTG